MNQDRKPSQEEIAVCAFFIWEAEGRPEGREQMHWLQAEMQLEATCAHESWVSKEALPSPPEEKD
jgi:hypothetical protein